MTSKRPPISAASGATPGEVASQAMAAIADSAKQAVQSVDVDALLTQAAFMVAM